MEAMGQKGEDTITIRLGFVAFGWWRVPSTERHIACGCTGAIYCKDASVAFDPDVYNCARCGHMNGSHSGPNGECTQWWNC